MRIYLLILLYFIPFTLFAQTFTGLLPTQPFVGVNRACVIFADIDGDGDQDLLKTGKNYDDFHQTQLLVNDGTGAFTEVNSSLEHVSGGEGSSAFADVDGDGDQDIILTGSSNSGQITANLYINDGSGNFTLQAGSSFAGVGFGNVAFADVDGDDDLDVFIGGSGSTFNVGHLYTNDGLGNFIEMSGNDFHTGNGGSADFADIDGD
ncbi:MAG: VCBS repeat-containing protein, partial [Bacteroidota bacterium]